MHPWLAAGSNARQLVDSKNIAVNRLKRNCLRQSIPEKQRGQCMVHDRAKPSPAIDESSSGMGSAGFMLPWRFRGILLLAGHVATHKSCCPR